MTAIRYISDTKEIVKASWSTIQLDGMAEFKLSERSPVLRTLSTDDIHWEWTPVWNMNPIITIAWHLAESDEDSAPESISDTENWFDWNGDCNIPNHSEDDWKTANESDLPATQLHEGSRYPRTAGCECHTKSFQIVGEHWYLRTWFIRCWWSSTQQQCGEIRETQKCGIDCVNVVLPGPIWYLTDNII
jgi:hypothetical protein